MRAELLHHVERTCEIKAVHAVNSSPAYQLLCETLQKARADAEAKLKRVDATQNDDAVFQSILRKVRVHLLAIGSCGIYVICCCHSHCMSALQNIEVESLSLRTLSLVCMPSLLLVSFLV